MNALVPTVLPAVVVERDERTVPLSDLGIAPENLRFNKPPDDDIPNLAATLKAAGLLERLTVRPGRGRKEQPLMILNGRRRRLALEILLSAGEIDGDYPVPVYVETDPARQAAAVLLTNTALPPHVADVIAAIGRMLKAKLTVPGIATALGYAEIEIKRLAALSGLPPVVFDALRSGKLTLKQVRLLARLSDRKEQAAMAEQALKGFGFQDWRITERLNADRVTDRDRRCALVGAERYASAGGRMEVDLFGELAPVLLDPEILNRLWLERARALAMTLEDEGLEVHVTTGAYPELPDDLEQVAYVFGQLDATDTAAYHAARDRYLTQVEAAQQIPLCSDQAVDPLLTMIRARVAMDQAGSGGQLATVLVWLPSADTGVEVRCFGPVEAPASDDRDEDDHDDRPVAPPPAYAPPDVDAPEPDTEGVNHALHAVRTDVATRGLIRALADDPSAALAVLLARLFSVIVLRHHVARVDSASTVLAEAYGPSKTSVVDVLDGVVRQRLDDRRIAWQASGRTVIGWVHALAHGEKMALLAELTALSLDLRETRTDLVRARARADAAEIAALCQADLSLYWTPDTPFLSAHSKPQLLEMLVEMGAEDVRAGSLKKTELVDWVGEQAASRSWAPPGLSWTRAVEAEPTEATPTTDDEPASAGPSADDEEGPGVFEITAAGAAALEAAA